jgi:hypothetical protein
MRGLARSQAANLGAPTEQPQSSRSPEASRKASQNLVSSDFAWLLIIPEHEGKNNPYHSVWLGAIIQVADLREAPARQRESVSVEYFKGGLNVSELRARKERVKVSKSEIVPG